MCWSTNNGNNLHQNMHAKAGKPERKLTYLNTIEYDVKSSQVITTIGDCMDVRLKRLKILITHRIYV